MNTVSLVIALSLVAASVSAGDLSSGGMWSGMGQGLGQGLNQMQSGIIQQGLMEEQFRRQREAQYDRERWTQEFSQIEREQSEIQTLRDNLNQHVQRGRLLIKANPDQAASVEEEYERARAKFNQRVAIFNVRLEAFRARWGSR